MWLVAAIPKKIMLLGIAATIWDSVPPNHKTQNHLGRPLDGFIAASRALRSISFAVQCPPVQARRPLDGFIAKKDTSTTTDRCIF
jgi:hypothetical protein